MKNRQTVSEINCNPKKGRSPFGNNSNHFIKLVNEMQTFYIVYACGLRKKRIKKKRKERRG